MGALEGQPRILIIDDDSTTLRFLETHLVRLGYTVLTAGDGIAALAAAHREVPDLILLDLVLPHIDGIRVSRKLREDARFRNVPIILFTARTDTKLKVEALRAGANDYVTKPFEIEELVARLESHLKTKLLQDQLEEMQAKLITAGKRDAIIEMAGATAHELNQPLTAILGRLALLERKVEKEGPASRDIGVIREQGERLARLIQKLGRVSKYDTKTYVGERRIVDLETAAEDSPSGERRVAGIRVLVSGGGDPALAEAMQAVEREDGISVVIAGTREELMDQVARWRPDILVLDPSSPCWRGFETLEPVEKGRREENLPILLVRPAHASVDFEHEAIARGCYEMLSLPVAPTDLMLRLKSIARVSALAGRLAKLEEEVMRLQNFDRLTGLFNRKYFMNVLRTEVRRARRYRYPLSVAVLDVDDFATINYQWGQDFGDIVLKELALLIKGSVREADALGRYGGEEFCLILPHTSIENSRPAADRLQGRVLGQSGRIAEVLRQSIEGYLFERAERSTHVTVSMGIAGMDVGDTVEEDELLKRSESALKVAKSRGKNQVAIYGQDVARSTEDRDGEPTPVIPVPSQ